MWKLVVAVAGLVFLAPELGAQERPFLSAGVARWSVPDDYHPSASYGATAAIGMMGNRGSIEVVGGWFPEHDEDPRLAVAGLEGGPRITGERWKLGALVGLGGLHVGDVTWSSPTVCEDVCLFDVVLAYPLRRGWSGYATTELAAGVRATEWLELEVGYRFLWPLHDEPQGQSIRGWSIGLAHTIPGRY